ncbi:MAG: HEAT repeat domain-containing protein [Planctomycetes bacterium]|nr:HEAT repeat domain-containing protein [Planctomycetota bacterium]MCW8136289.1 HEAT repeat domain-containing protein [Planctomycetota bacterium]
MLVLLLLLAAPLFAQDTKPDLDELWRVGSLWEVGDNPPKVRAARQAIIDAGEDGLNYALGKLETTDGLQLRCLNAVILGFGKAAIEPLSKHIAHTSPVARRTVADLLLSLDARDTAAKLLVQAKVETADGARLAQVKALATWHHRECVPLLIDLSRVENQRVRNAAPALLAKFDESAPAARLMEMLEDAVYHVRDAAAEALKAATVGARRQCLSRLIEVLPFEDKAGLARRLLPIVATLADEQTLPVLRKALGHSAPGVRADAARALAGWRKGAGALELVDVNALLSKAASAEPDPFAKAEIQAALEALTEK